MTRLSNAIQLIKYPVIEKLTKKVRLLFSRKYLLYTNIAISVCMSGVGDGLQQTMQVLKQEMAGWDRHRSRDVVVWSAMIAPCCHYWYIYLDWLLPGRTLVVVGKKLILEQLVCSPSVIASYLYYTSYMEGKRSSELHSEVWNKGKTLYKAECLIWPPAQVINFRFLPTRYRVMYDNIISFGFDCYFSYVKYGKSDTTTHKNYNNKNNSYDCSRHAIISTYGSNNICGSLLNEKSYRLHTHGIHAEALLLKSRRRKLQAADICTCSPDFQQDPDQDEDR